MSLIIVWVGNRMTLAKNRNLDDFCCQSEKKDLREVLGKSLEQFHGVRIQIG